MRYLNGNNAHSDGLIERKEVKEINKELIDIGDRITELENEVHADEQALQDYKDETSITKQQGNFDAVYTKEAKTDVLNAETGNIDAVNAKTVNATDKVTTKDETVTGKATVNEAEIKSLSAAEANVASLNAPSAEVTNLAATRVDADTGEFNTLTIDTATIQTFNIEDAKVNKDLTVGNKVTATEAQLTTLVSDKATMNLIDSDAALLEKMQTHNITYDDTLKLPYYVPIEPGTFPTGDIYRVLEVPFFDTGDYYLCLKDPSTDICWWSVIVHNNHNNITVSYSRRTTDRDGNELTVPTLDEMYIYDYFSQGPKLYLKTFVGGNLYWQNQSLNEERAPAVYNDYPFDVSRYGALQYKCLHDGATWFSKHIDIIRNQSADNASLFLIPTDWNNANRETVEYNGLIDIPWHFYTPNQPVNTTDEVTFRNVIIDPLDGKWVYNIENALQGKNPELMGTDGQLNPADNLIETDELAKWKGKVGVAESNITQVSGTIFREQGYTQTSTNVYERRNPDSYNTVAWVTKNTRNDVIAVRRKSDWAIIKSSPFIAGKYEDEEQITWISYRYVFYDINPDGQCFEEWIERKLPDGTYTHKLLQTTVSADDYINYTRFKEDFDDGTIAYDVYSYGNYSNPIVHLGDVIEGRWDAGDVHVTKKAHISNSSEPDYNGSLTVDGKTNLRDNVLVQDLSDPDNPANVNTVELHSDNYLNNAVKTDIKVSEAHNVTVGTASVPAKETHTVYGDIDTHIEGKSQLNVTGDTTTVIGTSANPTDPTSTNTQNTVTINSDSNVNLKGKTAITYNELELVGHKKDAFNEDIPGSHMLIRDDVTIGQADDRHDLVVHGKLNVDAMAFVGDPGDNMRIRDIGTAAEPNIVAVAEHCAECDIPAGKTTGKLLPEDKLVTAKVVSQYDGTVKNATTADPTAPDTYPITNLGDETNVHGDLHVKETSQLDGNVTVGVAAAGTDPEKPADLHVIGNANIDYKMSAKSGDIKDDLTVHGDHFVEHDLIVDKNATVHGDLIVDGTVVATDEKSIVTSSDYAVLRKSKLNGLSSTEKSGFVVHNYDGNGSNASLAVDNDGIFRVSDNATETTTSYTNKSYFNGTYYDGLTSTVATVVSGAEVSQDADNFSDCVNNAGTYYHYDNKLWFELSLVNNSLVYNKDSPVTSAALITTLDGLTKHDLTYFRSFTVMQISDSGNQPILTRAEASDIYDKAPLIWDATNEKAVPGTSAAPTKSKQAMISVIDPATGNISYEWGEAGGGSGAVLVLTTAEYNRRAAITDMEDEEYIPNNALVVITDADDEYLYGEVEAVAP